MSHDSYIAKDMNNQIGGNAALGASAVAVFTLGFVQLASALTAGLVVSTFVTHRYSKVNPFIYPRLIAKWMSLLLLVTTGLVWYGGEPPGGTATSILTVWAVVAGTVKFWEQDVEALAKFGIVQERHAHTWTRAFFWMALPVIVLYLMILINESKYYDNRVNLWEFFVGFINSFLALTDTISDALISYVGSWPARLMAIVISLFFFYQAALIPARYVGLWFNFGVRRSAKKFFLENPALAIQLLIEHSEGKVSFSDEELKNAKVKNYVAKLRKATKQSALKRTLYTVTMIVCFYGLGWSLMNAWVWLKSFWAWL